MDQNLLVLVGSIVFGLISGYFIRQAIAIGKANSLEQKIKAKVEDAKREAQDIVLRAKDKSAGLLDEAKKEEVEHKRRLDKVEERLVNKEETLERQSRELSGKQKDLEKEFSQVDQAKAETAQLYQQAAQRLERAAGMNVAEAKEYLLKTAREEYGKDLFEMAQKMERERLEEIEKKSVGIITTALQRYARSHVAELTTTSFTLPDENLKGKIIGREGRNIRTLERLTGVDVIVDETPESIIISSFDPLRRETARLALEKLIKDGRIQPAKIEEKVEEAKRELDKRMQEVGEAAVYELGIVDLPKEIVQLLGRLNFRTSYGQNVLVHSIEMAHIAGMIASELGLDAALAKKGALVHDIGKAIDHEAEGTHIELGRKLLKKYSVDERVILAMEAHHDDYPHAIPEAFVVTAADVLSGARPGARRDSIDSYLKRLEDLEKIALEFDGVKIAYAISGGREIRVFVVPEKIDDFAALQLAKNISGKIKGEMKFPGEIKVNVIREMRAVEYAR